MSVEKFRNLWVIVRDGKVYKGGILLGSSGGTLLGSLAGAHAQVIVGQIAGTHRRTGGQRAGDAFLVTAATGSPLGLLAGAYSRPGSRGVKTVATLMITFTDAPVSVFTTRPTQAAKAEAERFNALAGTTDTPE